MRLPEPLVHLALLAVADPLLGRRLVHAAHCCGRHAAASTSPTAYRTCARAVSVSEQPASTRHVGQLVAPGGAAVDDDDRGRRLARAPDEPQPGHDRQRRAGDQQRPGRGVDERVARSHPVAWARSRRRTRRRASARRRSRCTRRAGSRRFARGRRHRPGPPPARRGVAEPGLSASQPLAAARRAGRCRRQPRQTTSAIRPCRSIDRAAAGGPVQAVDVLRDHPAQHPGRLERGHGAVAGVRLGAAHPRPAEVAARPVAPLRRRPGDELAGTSSAGAGRPGPR